jgi:hypothetical protein
MMMLWISESIIEKAMAPQAARFSTRTLLVESFKTRRRLRSLLETNCFADLFKKF